MLIWEERNSGRYEHARACRERALAPLDEMITQPSPLLYFLKDMVFLILGGKVVAGLK
jgi:hypothetical protein